MSTRPVTLPSGPLHPGVAQEPLEQNVDLLARLLPARLLGVHEAVVDRARTARASALVLTGSTVRGRRTEISDLDYHLIGSRFETARISREIDLHALTVPRHFTIRSSLGRGQRVERGRGAVELTGARELQGITAAGQPGTGGQQIYSRLPRPYRKPKSFPRRWVILSV